MKSGRDSDPRSPFCAGEEQHLLSYLMHLWNFTETCVKTDHVTYKRCYIPALIRHFVLKQQRFNLNYVLCRLTRATTANLV